MRITSEVAHSILVKLKKLVNYNINIMNSDGVIVGSTDSSRLHQIHQGALMVFDTKKAIFIYSEDEAHFPGAKPGVNLETITIP
jgi:carbohydrate diacid regulator